MEDNKKKIPDTTITRNTALFSDMTENIYETVAVLTKRANQIAIEEKKELKKQIEEFTASNDGMDEYYENREQVEAVRRFERMPKPVLTLPRNTSTRRSTTATPPRRTSTSRRWKRWRIRLSLIRNK